MKQTLLAVARFLACLVAIVGVMAAMFVVAVAFSIWFVAVAPYAWLDS